MGKEYKNIDDLFRSELGGDVTKAPAFVKGNIDKALGFNKRFKPLMILCAMALISTAAITYFVMTDFETPTAYQQLGVDSTAKQDVYTRITNQHQVTDNTMQMSGQQIASTTWNSNQVAFSDGGRQKLANTKNSLISPGLNPQNNNKRDNTTSGIKNNIVSDNKGTIKNKYNNTDSDNDIALLKNILANDSVVIDDDALFRKQLNAFFSIDNIDTTKNQTIIDAPAYITDSAAVFGTANNQDDLTNNPQNTLTNNLDTTLDNTNAIATNEIIDTTQTANETLTSDTIGLAAVTPETEITKKPESLYKPWMVTLTSGANFAKSAYNSNQMSEQTYYENSLEDRIGSQTNLDVAYRLKNGLTFGTGLGVSQYSDNYNFKTSTTVLDSVPETIYEYEYVYEYDYVFSIDSVGGAVDSTYVLVDSTGTISDSSIYYNVSSTDVKDTKQGVNKATYLTVPIHFGTQIIYKKFQFDLFAALRFNFLLGSRGAYVTDGTFTSFGKGNSIYRSVYVDWNLGTKVHYNIWNNLYLTGTVRYRPVSGMAFKDISINKSFDYIHAGIGLSIRL